MANTIGEKELKTSWDAQTAADATKFIGHETSLKAEQSSVPARYKVGLD